jgi:hypothetical protein
MGGEKMKVAIITITNGQNYGNRLQNYALQQTLCKLNIEAETIKLLTFRELPMWKCKTMVKRFVKFVIKYHYERYSGKCYRVRNFREFDNKYIKLSKVKISKNKIPKDLNSMYGYFICGSDQVFNCNFDTVADNIKNHLASFAYHDKRISYAASFGTDNVAPGYEDIFARELNKFKAISVRENSGVDIVRKITGRDDAQVVLDPTMLLTTDEWKSIARKPSYINRNKFIVTYFLGGRSAVMKAYLDRISSIFDAKVINLEIDCLDDTAIENLDVFASAPDEFVWLIENAECVLTDSFHATVFSILFHKPFCVFDRTEFGKDNNMQGRIETLLEMFDLKGFYDDLNNPTVVPCEYPTDNFENVLSRERGKSFDFLKNALEIDR